MTHYEKYCSKCGFTQPILMVGGSSYGYCYEKLHFVTKKPYAKKYEVNEN